MWISELSLTDLLFFLRISLDLLTVLACSCILFRCNLIWHNYCLLHRNHFHRRGFAAYSAENHCVTQKIYTLLHIFVKYSYCSRRVVLVRIPPTTRRRSSPPPPDFLTSYLEKTALANWTGLYPVFVFVFVFVFLFCIGVCVCICILASIGLHPQVPFWKRDILLQRCFTSTNP